MLEFISSVLMKALPVWIPGEIMKLQKLAGASWRSSRPQAAPELNLCPVWQRAVGAECINADADLTLTSQRRNKLKC